MQIVGLGLGSDLVSGWLVVMHTYLYYFRLSSLQLPMYACSFLLDEFSLKIRVRMGRVVF